MHLVYESLLLYNATTGEMQPSLVQSFRQTDVGIEVRLDFERTGHDQSEFAE